jgi:hypothetical protein
MSMKVLRLMDADTVEGLKISLGQRLLLKDMVSTLKPPEHCRLLPPQPTSQRRLEEEAGFDPQQLLRMFASNEDNYVTATTVAAGKIDVDFTKYISIATTASPRDQQHLTLVDGQLVLSQKKVPLESVTIAQYFEASLKIARLMEQQQSTDVAQYRLYLERIAQLAQVFTWPSVLLFDREFRKRVQEAAVRWDDESAYLMSLFLRPIPARSTGLKSDQKPRLDPASRKEVCFRWQRGQCTNAQACKYAHVCIVCFGDHPDIGDHLDKDHKSPHSSAEGKN